MHLFFKEQNIWNTIQSMAYSAIVHFTIITPSPLIQSVL